MCMTSVLFRSDVDEDDDDDEGGEGLCEQQEQPTLRKSSYVKQIGKFDNRSLETRTKNNML